MKKFLLLTLLIPHLAFGAVAISWLATSTSQGWVFPQKINGVEQVITGTNFIATSTSNSVFPRFLFTLATGTSATTTNLGITSIASKLLKVDGNGTVLGATAGTDYENILTAGDGLTRTLNDFDCDTASGSVFGCLASADWTTFNDKVSATRALTIAGTANQITSSAGAQDLSADRTWTLSLPSLVVFPSNASSTQLTTTGATYLATTGGNVGIGTTSPLSTLAIGSLSSNGVTLGGTNPILELDETGSSLPVFRFKKPGVSKWSMETDTTFAQLILRDQVNGRNNLILENDGDVLLASSGTGNVGIGTTSPANLLDVNYVLRV